MASRKAAQARCKLAVHAPLRRQVATKLLLQWSPERISGWLRQEFANVPSMTEHKALSIATDLKVYFCDPQSPWQRGTNENTNGLLRQYFPKGTSLSHYSQAALNAIARRLNGRPRKTLGFTTPAESFQQALR